MLDMKIVILAGGFGTRISEESHLKPKPLIEIGNIPIIVHIMKYYSHFGFDDFIICCGYKGYMIKEYFSKYFLINSDITIDMINRKQILLTPPACKWRVTLIDTGLNTLTGGRVKRIEKYIDDDNFMLTYGDGVSNVDLNELIATHQKKSDSLCTLTAVNPVGRFGTINISQDGVVNNFSEKTREESGWINGGFMVLNKKIINYIQSDETSFEFDVLPKIANKGQLYAYKHYGFWQCMDTLRDKNHLDELIVQKKAPWIVWE